MLKQKYKKNLKEKVENHKELLHKNIYKLYFKFHGQNLLKKLKILILLKKYLIKIILG